MYAVIHCTDKAGSSDLRAATRAEHLEYLEGRRKQILIAGPMLDDAGEATIGSLLIIEAEDLAAARAFADGDPYAKAGLFAEAAVRPWKRVIG